MIALVITIIVLLILAGITIVTLTGDNGLLQKTAETKNVNEAATSKEKLQVEVSGSYGLDGKINKDELNKHLKHIDALRYNDEEIILDGDNKNIIEQLPAEVFVNNNSFFIDENGNVLDWKYADLINSKIGNVIDGYTAANLEWQIFYSDPVETFLISKTLAKTNWVVPQKREKQSEDEVEYEYKGSEDIKKMKYGSKWNKKWLAKLGNGNSTSPHVKAVAYMCDPINWKEYVIDGVANYAIGGPTLEMFIASWNKSQGQNVSLLDEDITINGVETQRPSELGGGYGPVSNLINNGVYNPGMG